MSWCCPCFESSSKGDSKRTPLLANDFLDGGYEGENGMSRGGESEANWLRPISCEGHGGEGPSSETGVCMHDFQDVYMLKDHIGKGSTSSCFKCIHRRSGNVLAVKVIDKRRVKLMYNELLLGQFRQEVAVLRHLSHPHIIRLFEVFESEAALHVVTEYVQGGELFDYLVERPDRLLSEAEASGIIRQVAWALAYMHKEGVMHRDLKLENILVSHRPGDDEEYPTIKLIDFGLAKMFRPNDPLVVTEEEAAAPGGGVLEMRPTANTFFGTLGYIAPEMMRRRGYTSQVDIWALGVLTYVLLCGIFPFDDDPNVAITRKADSYQVKYPPWAKISESSKDLLKKLLEVNPNKRLTAGKTMMHPWVAGETASKAAVLGTPKLLEELRLNNMYGTQKDLKVSAAVNRLTSNNSRGSMSAAGLDEDALNLNNGGAIHRGSVSPLTLDESIRKTLRNVIE